MVVVDLGQPPEQLLQPKIGLRIAQIVFGQPPAIRIDALSECGAPGAVYPELMNEA